MTDQKYVGAGTSLDDATRKLYKAAQNKGVVGRPTEVEYHCRVKVGENYISGQPSADYGTALASALEEAKVTEKDAKELEVFATGTYAAVEQAKPKAAGAAASPRASGSLTDLF